MNEHTNVICLFLSQSPSTVSALKEWPSFTPQLLHQWCRVWAATNGPFQRRIYDSSPVETDLEQVDWAAVCREYGLGQFATDKKTTWRDREPLL